jgi:hypothetical protein
LIFMATARKHVVQHDGRSGLEELLRKGSGLRQQEPRPEPQRRGRAHPFELLDSRNNVEDGHARHALGMIERHSVGDPRAAVMTDDGEALVGECGHDLDEIARHLALAEALAVRTAGGRARRTVTAQVRRHYSVVSRESRRYRAPEEVRLRKTVQEEHGRALAAGRIVVVGLADDVSRLAEAGQPRITHRLSQVEVVVGGACPRATSMLGVLARSSRV